MNERPILFSGPMVRAILDGRKTQTRRVMKVQAPHEIELDDPADPGFASTCAVLSAGPSRWSEGAMRWTIGASWGSQPCPERDAHKLPSLKCPYGAPGDRLWVRETWDTDGKTIAYRATTPETTTDPEPMRWRPSIHMPRWASRLTLAVTSVRVERVQEITEADARAEGIEPQRSDYSGEDSNSLQFRDLWDSINAARGYGWAVNPWVWVVEFERVQP